MAILDNRQAKRIMLVLLISLGLLVILASTASAGGWFDIKPGGSTTGDDGTWSSVKSPHNDLQTSTNQCKACHSVHEAEISKNGIDNSDMYGPNDKSFKLLRDKNRVTECNSCHDATSGLSDMRPYKIGESKKVRGEHSLGSTRIPDGDENKIFNGIDRDGLSCGTCHSVHGSYTMSGNNVDSAWANKILKRDPANNGGDAGVSTKYFVNGQETDIAGGFTVTATNSNANNSFGGSKSAFCIDCHNQNSNWDDNPNDELGVAADYGRPNSESHVQGPAGDGDMAVNGQTVKVANYRTPDDPKNPEPQEVTNAGRTGLRLDQSTQGGCLSCHQANNDGANSAFPHQSTGSKLLIANYTSGETISGQTQDPGWQNERITEGKAEGMRQSNRGINQANRSLVSLDKVCLDCHRDRRGLENDTQGVGKTF